jgi:Xaa-Pro aminopeptidase
MEERITYFSARRARIEQGLLDAGLDAAIFTQGAELAWLCGYEASTLERPTILLLRPQEQPWLAIPALEEPRLEGVLAERESFCVRPWVDGEDPVELVSDMLSGAGRIVVSDQTRWGFLHALKSRLGGVQLGLTSPITSPIRAVKDELELRALEAAAKAADRVVHQLQTGEIRLIGRTELDVAKEIRERLVAEGHARAEFAIVASGPNGASPHHEPSGRRIGAGEVVVVDFGGAFYLGGPPGYCSDVTRTLATGEVGPEVLEVHEAVKKAQAKAREAVDVGVPAKDVDLVARSWISQSGFGEAFLHRTGHGIGVEVHEDPYIVSTNASPLRVGNAFSVEPGVYLKGRFGVRIEDIVVIAGDGVRSLNSAPRDLVVVEA